MGNITIGVELSGIPASDRARGEYLAEGLRKLGYNAFNANEGDKVDLRISRKRDFFREKNEKYMIFDVSDAILTPPRHFSTAKKLYQQLVANQRIRRFLSHCDAVVVASTEQRRIMRKYNDNTYVIPDRSYYHELYDPSVKPDPKDRIIFVWDGQGHNFRYVQKVIEEHSEFFRKKDVLLKVITDRIDASRNIDNKELLHSYAINAEFVEWASQTYISEVNKSHIGLAPVDMRCRHAMAKPENKLLNYQGLGLPAIASATKAFVEFASRSPGRTFVCSSHDDWEEALEYCRKNRRGLFEDGYQGRQFVCTNYAAETLASSWQEVIDNVINARSP